VSISGYSNVDKHDRELIDIIYIRIKIWSHTAVVRIEVDSEPGITWRTIRQDCPLSPLLFHVYVQKFLDEALENIEDEVNFGGHLVNTVRFADDQAMVENSEAGL